MVHGAPSDHRRTRTLLDSSIVDDPAPEPMTSPARPRRVRSTVRRWGWLPGVLLLAVVAAQGDPAPPSDAQAAGIAVYRANYCGACHALTVAGTGGTFGPTHDGMAEVAAARLHDPAYAGAAVTPTQYLRESILDPNAYLTPGYAQSAHAMPAFVHLPEEDLEALVVLLLAQ